MKRLAGTLLSLLLCFGQAHPVDEVVQGAYLTLAPGVVKLELDLTLGTQVAGAVLGTLDVNADQTVTAAEARAYAQGVLEQSTLTLSGATVPWELAEVIVPTYQNLFGSDTLKIYATAECPNELGEQTLSYQNRYRPVKSQWTANIFLQPTADWQLQITDQGRSDDGRQLTVTYQVTRP